MLGLARDEVAVVGVSLEVKLRTQRAMALVPDSEMNVPNSTAIGSRKDGAETVGALRVGPALSPVLESRVYGNWLTVLEAAFFPWVPILAVSVGLPDNDLRSLQRIASGIEDPSLDQDDLPIRAVVTISDTSQIRITLGVEIHGEERAEAGAGSRLERSGGEGRGQEDAQGSKDKAAGKSHGRFLLLGVVEESSLNSLRRP